MIDTGLPFLPVLPQVDMELTRFQLAFVIREMEVARETHRRAELREKTAIAVIVISLIVTTIQVWYVLLLASKITSAPRAGL